MSPVVPPASNPKPISASSDPVTIITIRPAFIVLPPPSRRTQTPTAGVKLRGPRRQSRATPVAEVVQTGERFRTGAAAMEPYFDLGSYTRGTSTASASAQMWFDRGLVWSYAFHHEEAIRCFERAVEHDPGFALARWGIAYAIGPNYNKQWEAFDPVDLAASLDKACEEVAAARARADRAATVEPA